MLKRTRKAIVLPETLKLVIAILCILLLIYLAWSLYNIFVVKSKSAQAKETLEQIVAKINGLEEGESREYLVNSPKDWRIIYYSDIKKICLCPQVLNSGEQKDVCIKQGFCKESGLNIRIDNFCKYDDQVTNIYQTENCISLVNLPKQIISYREGNNYFLGTKEQKEFSQAKEQLMSFKGAEQESLEQLIKNYLENKDDKIIILLQKQIELFLISKGVVKSDRTGSDKEEGWQLSIWKNNAVQKIISSPENRGMYYVLRETLTPNEWLIKISSGEEYTIKLYIGVWDYIPPI